MSPDAHANDNANFNVDADPNEPPGPLETRLAGWRPSPSGPSRDRVLFEAGRASKARGVGPWRASTILLALIGLGLSADGVRLRSRQARLEVELAEVRAPRPASDAPERLVGPSPDLPSVPLGPSSQWTLTARLAAGDLELASPSSGPALDRPAPPPLDRPLRVRPRGFDGGLDL